MRFLFLSLVLQGCLTGVPDRGEVLDSCDPAARDGLNGNCGPLGAARVHFDVQSRIDEALPIEVVYPADADGNLATGGPFPVVVIVQGGLVTSDRYRWLGEHFATRGYVSIIPGHFAELAVLETDNARIALKSVEREAKKRNVLSGAIDENSRAAVMGHSLGGVIATWNWLTTDRFTALALLASYPNDADRLDKRAGAPVLSIVGGNDGRAALDKVQAGFDRFAEPKQFALIDGMTHYDWTDAANAGELASEPEPGRPQALTRKDAFAVIDTWLDRVLRDGISP